jgi:hypothetical protein
MSLCYIMFSIKIFIFFFNGNVVWKDEAVMQLQYNVATENLNSGNAEEDQTLVGPIASLLCLNEFRAICEIGSVNEMFRSTRNDGKRDRNSGELKKSFAQDLFL